MRAVAVILVAGCSGTAPTLEGTLTGRVDGAPFEVGLKGSGVVTPGEAGPTIRFDGNARVRESARALTGMRLDLDELPPEVLWAGGFSIEAWALDLGGLQTTGDGTRAPLVLTTTDASWRGGDRAPWTSTGTLTGTIPLEEGAGEIALDATFRLSVDCSATTDPICGGGEDSAATTWDGSFAERDCPDALLQAIAPSGAVDFTGGELRFGEAEPFDCARTGAGRLCGVEVDGIEATGCAWKAVAVASPSLETFLVAGYAAEGCALEVTECVARR